MIQRSLPRPVPQARLPLLGLGSLAIASLVLPACIDVGPGEFPQLGTGPIDASDDGGQSTGSSTSDGGTDPDGTTGDPVDPDTGTSCASSDANITVVSPDQVAVEGGEPITYTVRLDAQPCADVTLTITGDAQLEVDPLLVFTPADWDIPRDVSVTAVHDFERESDHFGLIAHTVESDDLGFDGLPLADLMVSVLDRAHLAHVSMPLVDAGTNADSRIPRVSEDGRWVAFLSDANNLIIGDSGLHQDAYLRDLDADTTVRISEGSSGEANGPTTALDMSADGSVIGFHSAATNLVPTEVSDQGEIYVRNGEGPLTVLSSLCAPCNETLAQDVSVSSDGVFAAFATTRLMTGGGSTDNDGQTDAFTVRLSDLQVTLDSLNGGDQNGTFFWGSNSFGPILSRDGTYMGFHAAAQNLDVPEITVQNFHVYLKNRITRELDRVSRHNGGNANCDGTHRVSNSSTAHSSDDGSVVVFSSGCNFVLSPAQAADQAGYSDVFVRDIAAMSTSRISEAYDGTEANGDSVLLDTSDDARYVLFRSDATNIVPDDTNGVTDLFVHDRMTGLTTWAAYGEAYEPLVSGVDNRAALSADGAWVVFATSDSLLPSDGNGNHLDVYRVRLR